MFYFTYRKFEFLWKKEENIILYLFQVEIIFGQKENFARIF